MLKTSVREKILVYGQTQKGENVFLGIPAYFSIKKDINAASLLDVKLRVDGKMDSFSFVKVVLQGREIFNGIPDEEIYTATKGSIYLEIIARCKISLLIDNEVMPSEIKNPSVSFFSRKYLEPLGFKIKSSEKKGHGELKAGRGTSTLGFLNSFFTDILGTEAVIKDDGSIFLLSEYEPFSLYPDEKKVLKIETARKSYMEVSEYVLKDSFSGAYHTVIKNPRELGFMRRKYRDNPGDINFGTLCETKLYLEGFVFAELYDYVECFDEKGVVVSIRYERTPEGDVTMLLFKTYEE